MGEDTAFWKAKLSAWVHDPAEKALVLMRDPGVSHEHGTVARLREALGIAYQDFNKQADWFAAGADRPGWPDDKLKKPWSSVYFADAPKLIHPLSGKDIALSSLSEVSPSQIKAVSFDHFHDLIDRNEDGTVNYRRTYLAFWRFGYEPDLAAPEFGALWQLLPADTRVPDHSIWEHLDVTSALAGALHYGKPALLMMSFGPVQTFIAQARSTSDLWAGSHLVSSLVWEGLSALCEELGPDAVLYPNLRGVAAVDRWLLDSAPENLWKKWRERFERCRSAWLKKSTDENPLFSATLTNKFVAIVPSEHAARLAALVATQVRTAAHDWALAAAGGLFEQEAKTGSNIHKQVEAQLAGFPDAYWSVADWPVPQRGESGLPSAADLKELRQALGAFYPESNGAAPGVFGKPVWQVLNREVPLDDVVFYRPGAGLLYAPVYELAERSLAAAKACRPFTQLRQQGYRCTICGEREWLTNDHKALFISPGRRAGNSVWSRLVGKHGIKEREHLCALCTLKRMWPEVFRDQVKEFLGADSIPRFVVSTHAMAIATSLAKFGKLPDDKKAVLQRIGEQTQSDDPVVYPVGLIRRFGKNGYSPEQIRTLRCLPSLLERINGDAASGESQRNKSESPDIRKAIEDLLGGPIESYYALLLMDGDKMGAWVSGSEQHAITYGQSFHPHIAAEMRAYQAKNSALREYLTSPRTVSPSRQAAISTALNGFSSVIVRCVIEDCFKGRLIYSGGDDVLAMLPVDDLLGAIQLLRAAYSGSESALGGGRLRLGNGYAQVVEQQPLRMMGTNATASVGAVVVHHNHPDESAARRPLARADRRPHHRRQPAGPRGTQRLSHRTEWRIDAAQADSA